MEPSLNMHNIVHSKNFWYFIRRAMKIMYSLPSNKSTKLEKICKRNKLRALFMSIYYRLGGEYSNGRCDDYERLKY